MVETPRLASLHAASGSAYALGICLSELSLTSRDLPVCIRKSGAEHDMKSEIAAIMMHCSGR